MDSDVRISPIHASWEFPTNGSNGSTELGIDSRTLTSRHFQDSVAGMEPPWVKTLALSLSLNFYTLSHLSISLLVQYLYCRRQRLYVGCQRENIWKISSRRKSYISQLCTEIAVSLVLASIAVATCFGAGVLTHPFLVGPDISPVWRNLVIISFAANVGKYTYLIALSLAQRTSSVDLNLTIVHHTVTFVFYVTVLATDENWLMANVGLLMEVSVVIPHLMRICDKWGVSLPSHRSKIMRLSHFFVVLFVRLFLPVVMVVYGLSSAYPFSMGYISLILFFLCSVFYSVIGVYMTVMAAVKCRSHAPETLTQSLVHEVHNDCQSPTNDGDANNMTYLKPYQNINVYSNDIEALNMAESKVKTKRINALLDFKEEGGATDDKTPLKTEMFLTSESKFPDLFDQARNTKDNCQRQAFVLNNLLSVRDMTERSSKMETETLPIG